jgi:sphingomyelin phosphodiesterase 2
MMMRHPDLGCSLSDHFSIEATLAFHPLQQPQPSSPSPPAPESASNRDSTPTATGTLQPSDEPASPPPPQTTLEKPKTNSALDNGTYLQLQSPAPSITHDENPTPHSQLLHPSPDALPASAYDTILALIKSYRAREESQLTWRARHFFLSVLASIACLVGVWFTPAGMNFVAFILMLVSTLGLAAGTVDGLMSLLFFRAELKALREFEWEVRNRRGLVFGGGGAGVDDGEERDGEGDGDERGW